jgi:membrane associated rhomboid family serine protease
MYGRQSMRFGPPETPEIIKQLMIANLVVFIAQFVSPYISDLGAVRPVAVWQEGYFWQPFTYMWLHGGFMHIAMNCFALWMFGSDLAIVWGKERFLRYYLLCGIGAGFIIASWPYLLLLFLPDTAEASGLDTYTLGASGAVYGVVLGYSLVFPDRRIMLIFPPVSFRAIWLIPALLVMTIAMSGSEGGISHIGHLGGVLVGWLYLRRLGTADELISSGTPASSRAVQSNIVKRRWRRWRMRKKLRAVRPEDDPQRRNDQDHNEHDLTP